MIFHDFFFINFIKSADLSNKKEKQEKNDKNDKNDKKIDKNQSPPKLIDVLTTKSQPEKKNFKKKGKINGGRPKALDQELVTAPKSKLLINLKKTFANSNKDEFDIIGLEYNQIKNLYISFDSGKMTSTLINLDIEEMTYCLACVILKFIEYGENKGEIPIFLDKKAILQENENYALLLNYKKIDDSKNFDLSDKIIETPNKPNKDSFLILENRIKEIEKLRKNAKNQEKSGFYEENDEENKDLSISKNKDISINKQKVLLMSQHKDPSILHKSKDISLTKHVIDRSKDFSLSKNVELQDSEENYEEYVEEDYHDVHNNNPEDQDEIEFEQSKKEIENILKESLLVSKNDEKPTHFKNTATFKSNPVIEEEDKRFYDSTHKENNEDFEENEENDKNDENDENEENYQNNEISQYKETEGYYQSRLEENSKVNVSLCSKITYFDDNMHNELSFSRDLEGVFERAFNERSAERWITAKPSKDIISNFCKNIIITSKMEKEVTIICLIYIEKLIIRSGFHMTALNWRRIVFISLILASKVKEFYLNFV